MLNWLPGIPLMEMPPICPAMAMMAHLWNRARGGQDGGSGQGPEL